MPDGFKKYFHPVKALVKPMKSQSILCNTYLPVAYMGDILKSKDLMVTAKCTSQIAFWKEHHPKFSSKQQLQNSHGFLKKVEILQNINKLFNLDP